MPWPFATLGTWPAHVKESGLALRRALEMWFVSGAAAPDRGQSLGVLGLFLTGCGVGAPGTFPRALLSLPRAG